MGPSKTLHFGAIPFDVPMASKGGTGLPPDTKEPDEPVQVQRAPPEPATTAVFFSKGVPDTLLGGADDTSLDFWQGSPAQLPLTTIDAQIPASPEPQTMPGWQDQQQHLEHDSPVVNQEPPALPTRQSAQQRTAKQRLEFFSPPEIAGSAHDNTEVAGEKSVSKPGEEDSAATEFSQNGPAVRTHPASTSALPLAALNGSMESPEQPAEVGEPVLGDSRVRNDVKPSLDTGTRTAADLAATADTASDEALPHDDGTSLQASDGLSTGQPSSTALQHDGDGGFLFQGELDQKDQHASTPTAPETEMPPQLPADLFGHLKEPVPQTSAAPDSLEKAESGVDAVSVENSSTQKLLSEFYSQNVQELPALSAASAGLGEGPSKSVHGGAEGGQEEAGPIGSAPVSADAEPEEASSTTQQRSGSAAIKEASGATESESCQKGEQTAGMNLAAEPGVAQNPLSQSDATASSERQCTGQGEELTCAVAQLPIVLAEQENAGSSSISGTDSPIAEPAAVVNEQQRSLAALPEDDQAAAPGADDDEELPAHGAPLEAHSALEPAGDALAAPEAAAGAALPAKGLSPADRPVAAVKLPSLPVPPPVAPFKPFSFQPSDTSNGTSLQHAAVRPAAEAAGKSAASSAPEQELGKEQAAREGPAEAEGAAGSEGATGESAATDADLLALAEEVSRLEQELADAQDAAGKTAQQAEAASADAEAARVEAAEWREREADARAELSAIREAYTEVRGEAEAARVELQQLQAAHRALQDQMATRLREAHAVEGGKMALRLEKAERAIEQERATVRDLQRALAAARQASPAASPRKDAGQLRAALAAAQKELADARAAVEAQKLTNSGLQIRVSELLSVAEEVDKLRRACEQLRSRSDTIQASEDRAKHLEAAVETLRAQNNALHVTTERLLSTNSELGAKVNSQAAHINALETQLAEARAKGPAAPATAEPVGGVRFSESDLELLALAEYVKELEAALDRQRALSSSQQQGAPARTAPGPTNMKEAGSSSSNGTAAELRQADTATASQSSSELQTPTGPAEILSPMQERGQEAPQSPAPTKRYSVSWWEYITGADRATPVKRAS